MLTVYFVEPPPLVPPRKNLLEDDSQSVYDSVPRTEDVFNLYKKDLELHDKLGKWNSDDCDKCNITRLILVTAASMLENNE